MPDMLVDIQRLAALLDRVVAFTEWDESSHLPSSVTDDIGEMMAHVREHYPKEESDGPLHP